jgi:hypothetical protein
VIPDLTIEQIKRRGQNRYKESQLTASPNKHTNCHQDLKRTDISFFSKNAGELRVTILRNKNRKKIIQHTLG